MTVLCAPRIRLKAPNNKGTADALRYRATRQIICTVHVRITRRYFVIPQFVRLPRHTIRHSRWVFRGPQVLNIRGPRARVLTNDRCLHSSRNHWQRLAIYAKMRRRRKLPRSSDVWTACRIIGRIRSARVRCQIAWNRKIVQSHVLIKRLVLRGYIVQLLYRVA